MGKGIPQKNPLWVWVFVVLVRGPILFPLGCIAIAGEWAAAAQDWLGARMPGLHR
jgi:hypothetical protein